MDGTTVLITLVIKLTVRDVFSAVEVSIGHGTNFDLTTNLLRMSRLAPLEVTTLYGHSTFQFLVRITFGFPIYF